MAVKIPQNLVATRFPELPVDSFAAMCTGLAAFRQACYMICVSSIVRKRSCFGVSILLFSIVG